MTLAERTYIRGKILAPKATGVTYANLTPSVSSQYLPIQRSKTWVAWSTTPTSAPDARPEASGAQMQRLFAEFSVGENASRVSATAFPARQPAAFSAAFIKLTKLSSLKQNWNDRGAEPPGEMSIIHAGVALQRFHEKGLDAERVSAMPDGGVAIYYFGLDRIEGGARALYARVAIPNDDTICLTLANRSNETSMVYPIRPDLRGWNDAAELVSSFLGS